jgi:hypothetical protein
MKFASDDSPSFLPDPLDQYDDLLVAARIAMSTVNAEGATLLASLRHIREHAHEIAHYGIRQQAAAGLASAQTHHCLRPSVCFDQEMDEPLVKSFQEAYMISLSVDPEKAV